jgi:peptide-methionine (S)-S-oxide reductase
MRRFPLSRLTLAAAAGALALTTALVAPTFAAEEAVIIPAPAMDAPASGGIQTAVIAGGCFWGVQGVFQH